MVPTPARSIGRRLALLAIAAFLFAFLLVTMGRLAVAASKAGPIKVGVLHSLTGTMAISEVAVKNATLLAIDRTEPEGRRPGTSDRSRSSKTGPPTRRSSRRRRRS